MSGFGVDNGHHNKTDYYTGGWNDKAQQSQQNGEGTGVGNGCPVQPSGSGGWVENAEQAQKTKEAQKIGAPKTDIDGNGNITFTESQVRLVQAYSTPSLAPAANFTAQERNTFYMSINDKFNLTRTKTFNKGNSVMFDIYAMMSLIQMIAQSLRNTMRELRRLENQTVYVNIKAQAEIQRDAAFSSMIAGCVLAGVQLGVMVGGLGAQLKGIKMSQTAQINSGAQMAAEQAQMGRLASNPKMANTQLMKMEGKYANAAKNVVMTNTNKALGGAKSVEAALAKAKPKNLQQTKVAIHKAAVKDVQTYQGKFDAAREHNQLIQNSKTATPAEKQTAANELKTASEELRVARARQVDVTARLGMSDEFTSEFSQGLDFAAKGKADMAGMSGSSFSSQKLTVTGMLIQQVGMALGSLGQSFVQGIKEIMQSKATELQAEQKVIEEQFDQIKEMFGVQQSVIQKTIDTFSSIITKESSVNDSIFRAMA